MFSNQKKSFLKSKLFYGCIIALLVLFGLWLNYDGTGQGEEDRQVDAGAKIKENAYAGTDDSMTDPAGEIQAENYPAEPTETEDTAMAESEAGTGERYYLVREIDGVVKVFQRDEQGEESLYQITSVPFTLLSKEDQQLFAEGVRLKTQSELESFLENFDS